MDQLGRARLKSGPETYACMTGTLSWHGTGGSAAGRGTPVPPLIRLMVQKLSPTIRPGLRIRARHSMGCSSGLASITVPPRNSVAPTDPSSERWKKVINLQRKKC